MGAYRLLEPLGEGGSGSVWLAERCDGRFEGRAAVKLLNLALVGRSGQERFRREGTILARLQHPRIAHLVDAGISPGGQPYLVLEYVDGQPIDQYADARGLDVESRLRLFLDVLDGVTHAHASLIVHRDIKPANVLVSVDGSVKLLDFGIAKLVDADADADATRSQPRGSRPHARAEPGADAGVCRPRATGGRTGDHRHRHLRARRAPVRPALGPASRRTRAALAQHADPGHRRRGAATRIRCDRGRRE